MQFIEMEAIIAARDSNGSVQLNKDGSVVLERLMDIMVNAGKEIQIVARNEVTLASQIGIYLSIQSNPGYSSDKLVVVDTLYISDPKMFIGIERAITGRVKMQYRLIKIIVVMILLGMIGGCKMKKPGEMVENFKDLEYKEGPFENNIDSARAYLLNQMKEKYGEEFIVVGKERLENYGPFAGASYTARVATEINPEQVADAIVSQTKYKKVRDNYAVYYFEDEALLPVEELCKSKNYIVDYELSLTAPKTEKAWAKEDDIKYYLSESGAYADVRICFEPGKCNEEYTELIMDFLESIYISPINTQLKVGIDGVSRSLGKNKSGEEMFGEMDIFFRDIKSLGENKTIPFTYESVLEEVNDEYYLNQVEKSFESK